MQSSTIGQENVSRNVLSYAVLSFKPIVCTFSRCLTVTPDPLHYLRLSRFRKLLQHNFCQPRIFILARALLSCIACCRELKFYYD